MLMGRWLSRQPLRSLYIHRESPPQEWLVSIQDINKVTHSQIPIYSHGSNKQRHGAVVPRGVHSPSGCSPTPGCRFFDMCEGHEEMG